jgi:16S rRNA (uracil1498-N3)-methyltransferase
MRRFVLPAGSLIAGELDLDDDAATHVRDVLRFGPGDRFLVTDGEGVEAEAELLSVSKKHVRVRLERVQTLAPPSGLSLTLLQGVGKGDKMDAVVRQASELGVRTIVPVLTERAIAKGESRVDRWRAIAEDATRVSGRAHRPKIEHVVALEDVFARPRAPLALCFALDAAESLGAHLDARTTVEAAEVLVGPEGGLSPREVERAVAAGFSSVHLGPFTLRTETAGPAVVAMMLYWAKSIAR